ncbi:uncharacterized protein [Palaemon carinicauda]|uniref:uncharacterized protein n=1 Tax=Palaemon carinicauda TaxID=392227 RepID=UPI0035B59E62
MPQQHTSTDQVKFLGQWFSAWSEMQREDFLPILIQAYHPKDHINGLLGGIDSLKIQGRRPSLFDCQVKLFHDWIGCWTENERIELLEELRRIDPDFMCQYDKELRGESSRDASPPAECGEESQNPPSLVSSPPSTLPRSHSPHDSGLDEPPSDSDHTEPHSLDSHQGNDDPATPQAGSDRSSSSVSDEATLAQTSAEEAPERGKSADSATAKSLVITEDTCSPTESSNDTGEH